MNEDDPVRQKVHELAKDALSRNDPAGWFEGLYSWAGGNTNNIPWADGQPNPHLVEWLKREKPNGAGISACVVGCGLGDDAEELLKWGFEVTAFDISHSAIDWATKRFPQSKARFRQADLFDFPADWKGKFGFVFEAYTVQALPHNVRREAIEAVCSLVAPAGELLIVCRGRNETDDKGNLPWPLTMAELDWVKDAGLSELRHEDYVESRKGEEIRRFRSRFRRPAV